MAPGSRLPKEPAAEAAGSDGAEGHVQTLFKAYTWAYTIASFTELGTGICFNFAKHPAVLGSWLK